ncbi:hypothetical protein JYJ95_14300 [Corallococcus exiguus]|uniref:hypothetical protein n=1 Tax=Corallococcus exiguus TaxID=83462 RepID=UPI001A8CD5D1|nr:hypothetical protein [Corallococcus exiguus]MBN8467687.1 hypothetical protein [Corallococcus exiguus]
MKCERCNSTLKEACCVNPTCARFGKVVSAPAQTGSLTGKLQGLIIASLTNRDPHLVDDLRYVTLNKTGTLAYTYTEDKQLLGVRVQEEPFTVHHRAVDLLERLAKERPAALLINIKPALVAYSVDFSFVGHSPFINLLQGTMQKKGRAAVNECFVYVNYPPTDADLGFCIEQLKFDQHRLIHHDPARRVFFVMKPEKNARTRLLAAFRAPAQSQDLAFAEDRDGIPGKEKSVDALLDGEPLEYSDFVPSELPQLSGPPNSSRLTYEQLSESGKRVFDSIFQLATYAMASPVFGANEVHSVGALLVSRHGSILSWGIDTDGYRHAEVNTIKMLNGMDLSGGLADDCRLYTSLEPCFMCSGLLSSVGTSLLKRLTVIFGQVDPAVHKVFKDQQHVQAAPTFLKWKRGLEEILVDVPTGRGGMATRLDEKRDQFHQGHMKWVDEGIPTEIDRLSREKSTQLEQITTDVKSANSLRRTPDDELLQTLRQRYTPGEATAVEALVKIISSQRGPVEGSYGKKISALKIAQTSETERNKFNNSVMAIVKEKAFSRRFSKALLLLLTLVDAFDTSGTEGQHLFEHWRDTLLFLGKAHGKGLEDFMDRAARHLDETQGMNPYKSDGKSPDPTRYQQLFKSKAPTGL